MFNSQFWSSTSKFESLNFVKTYALRKVLLGSDFFSAVIRTI